MGEPIVSLLAVCGSSLNINNTNILMGEFELFSQALIVIISDVIIFVMIHVHVVFLMIHVKVQITPVCE